LKRRPGEQVSLEQADAEYENKYAAALRVVEIRDISWYLPRS